LIEPVGNQLRPEDKDKKAAGSCARARKKIE
jgi:hypothetical protein